jgi:hypothetical protein
MIASSATPAAANGIGRGHHKYRLCKRVILKSAALIWGRF